MKVIKFVSDDHIIAAIDGLRYVEKKDIHKSKKDQPEHYIFISYKGQEMQHMYDNAQDRDNLYNRIRHALGQRNKPKDDGLTIIDDLASVLQYALIRDKIMPGDYDEIKSIADKWSIPFDEALIPKEIKKNADGSYSMKPDKIYRITMDGPRPEKGDLIHNSGMEIKSVIELCDKKDVEK